MQILKTTIFVLLTFLVFACNSKKADSPGSEPATGKTGMEDINVIEVIPVAELLKNPDDYVDKEVRVEGLVTHVCRHSGQRLHLSDQNGEVRLRVEAGNEIKRFERDLEGSEIIAVGVLRKQVIDETYIEEMEHSGRGPKGMHVEDENDAGEKDSGEEADMQQQAENMRKMLKERGTDRIVMYWLDGASFEEKN